MAFDAYFLTGVLEELRTQALGARVEKIHQPSRDTLILLLRCAAGRQRLLIAANPTAPRAPPHGGQSGKSGPATHVLHAPAQAPVRRSPDQGGAAAYGAAGSAHLPVYQ